MTLALQTDKYNLNGVLVALRFVKSRVISWLIAMYKRHIEQSSSVFMK